jgi:hypothetical protein
LSKKFFFKLNYFYVPRVYYISGSTTSNKAAGTGSGITVATGAGVVVTVFLIVV